MLPKPKQYAAAATQTQTRRPISQPSGAARFVVQTAENAAGPLPGVCRACLGRDVRLYDMWQRGLGAMYARVVGVQINTEDKLPRQLCWECVGKLSSANRFKQKALKTQWILTNKITNCRLLTISDIESIDRAQEKLESTLGTKLNTVNKYDFRYTEETVEPNNFCNNKTIKSAKHNRNEDISNIEFNDNVEEQIIITEEFSVKVAPIKTEPVVVDVKEETYNNYTTAYKGGVYKEGGDTENAKISYEELAISIKQESTIDKLSGDNEMVSAMSKEGRQVADESSESEVCEALTRQSYKGSNNSLLPLRNQRSNMLPGGKELVVPSEDISLTLYNTDHSSKQVTANADQSKRHMIQKMKNEFLTPIKNKILFEDDLDTVTEFSADCVETVKLSHSFVNAPASTSHTINTNMSMNQKTNKLILSCTEFPSLLSERLFICDICDKSFHHKPTLILHINKHSKMHYCTYCSFKAYLKESVLRHVNAKHTKSEVFICTYCSYKTYRRSALSLHVNAKHTKSEVFNCTQCSYKAYRKYTLFRHVKIKHTKDEIFNCSYCSYKTYNKVHLLGHVNAKHIKSEYFKCAHCSYKAYQKTSLSRHINAKHTECEIFNCSHCSYKASRKDNLLRHVNAKHTKGEIFNCSQCSYKAYQKSILLRHVNDKHTKGETFNCSQCSYKAYQKANLLRHINAKHTKGETFNCSQCSYKAYQKTSLLRHVNAKHTKGEIPKG